MINNMKTILSAVKQYTEKGLKKSIPDWNESDPNSINYVKNRTHWAEEKEVKFMSGETIAEILQFGFPINITFEEGASYIVTLNGVRYELTASVIEGVNYIGNLAIINGSNDGSDTPFIIVTDNDANANIIVGPVGQYDIAKIVDGVESETIRETLYCAMEWYLVENSIEIGNVYNVVFNDISYELTAYEDQESGSGKIGTFGDTPFELFNIDDGWVGLRFMTNDIFTISITNLTTNTEILEEAYSVNYSWSEEQVTKKLEKDQKCTVTWNGQNYECIVKKVPWDNSLLYIGNLFYLYLNEDGYVPNENKEIITNEPFCIEYPVTEDEEWSYILSEYGNNTFSISTTGTVYHKIDEKYLPEMSNVGKSGTGKNAEIFNDYSNNIASGDYSHAEGGSTTASGSYSHAEGDNTTASVLYSHSEGYWTTASGISSHAEGDNTIASGKSSHAEGGSTTASGSYSHAEGDNTTASEKSSHAEGNGTKASGSYSHAEGYSTVASGESSHAEGVNATAAGYSSHAEGYATKATYFNDEVTTTSTTAKGYYTHAEGYGSVAYGAVSHAEGNGTKASGVNSHSEGYKTIASGNASHAEGVGTTAQRKSQHAQGEYNILDTEGTASSRGKYAHIVGNGTSDTKRSNAHTLDWKGNAWFSGDIYVGGIGQDDDAAKKVTTTENTLALIEEDYNPPFTPIIYGDGIFASPNKYSYDGFTWFDNGNNIGNVSAATYGNGVFILISSGESRSAYYSTDGINWESTTLPYFSYWRSVTYGNGKFVAVSQNKAAYSTDGVTWTGISVPSGAAGNHDIAYGNNKFVLVGGVNGAYSEDGITWNAVEGLSGFKVVYGNGLFIAAQSGNSSAGGYMYSADGINWTVVSGKIIRPQCLSYANGIFIGSHDVRSVDGITWTNYSLPSGLAENIIDVNGNIIAPGNKIFIARTNHIGNPKAYSYDGINWFTTCPATLIQNDVNVVDTVKELLALNSYEFITIADIDEICGNMESNDSLLQSDIDELMSQLQ